MFQKELHAYTITNAIEDRNVLRFHVDYFKPDKADMMGDTVKKSSIVKAILAKHRAATNEGRFNALFATGSINEAIEYYHLFKEMQAQKMKLDSDYEPLNIACVFSPPAEGNRDIQQIQEDLPQEQKDNEQEPDQKKAALMTIIRMDSSSNDGDPRKRKKASGQEPDVLIPASIVLHREYSSRAG